MKIQKNVQYLLEWFLSKPLFKNHFINLFGKKFPKSFLWTKKYLGRITKVDSFCLKRRIVETKIFNFFVVTDERWTKSPVAVFSYVTELMLNPSFVGRRCFLKYDFFPGEEKAKKYFAVRWLILKSGCSCCCFDLFCNFSCYLVKLN